MSTKTPEEVLALTFGWQGEDCFRAPLPATERFPVVRRSIPGLVGQWGVPYLDMPPYLSAGLERAGPVRASLFAGTGYLAGYDPDTFSDEHNVYVHGDNVPPEWVEPIEVALAEVRARWPDALLVFRPDMDGER